MTKKCYLKPAFSVHAYCPSAIMAASGPGTGNGKGTPDIPGGAVKEFHFIFEDDEDMDE